jgi:hypothetical protein
MTYVALDRHIEQDTLDRFGQCKIKGRQFKMRIIV